jgi:ABC-type polysaccharide/polyol phosphate export permease
VWRNVLVLFHNIIILVIVMIYTGSSVTWYSLLAIPGLLLISINGVWLGLLFGAICARFRDTQQIIASILQVSMFVTPIFWAPEQLGSRRNAFVNYNILYHFVDILRAPLLGKAPEDLSYYVVLGATVIGWVLTVFVLSRFRRRIPYWL